VSLFLDNGLRFGISLEVNDSLSIGTNLDIYYSDDGNTWQSMKTTCSIDDQHMCNFNSSSLGLFAVGTTEIPLAKWNTSDFVTQKFRESDPNEEEIISAFFGG